MSKVTNYRVTASSNASATSNPNWDREALSVEEIATDSFIATHPTLGTGPEASNARDAIAALAVENGYFNIQIEEEPESKKSTRKGVTPLRFKRSGKPDEGGHYNFLIYLDGKRVVIDGVKASIRSKDATTAKGAFYQLHPEFTTTNPNSEETMPAIDSKPRTKKASPRKSSPKASAPKTSPKKPSAKKATKKPAAKKGAPKASSKRADGLRKPQVRILEFLAKSSPATRKEISLRAPVDQASCVEYLGSTDEAKRLANDEKHFPSLITLGFVDTVITDNDGRTIVEYRITSKGKATIK